MTLDRSCPGLFVYRYASHLEIGNRFPYGLWRRRPFLTPEQLGTVGRNFKREGQVVSLPEMSQWGRYVEAFSYGAPKKTNEWSGFLGKSWHFVTRL